MRGAGPRLGRHRGVREPDAVDDLELLIGFGVMPEVQAGPALSVIESAIGALLGEAALAEVATRHAIAESELRGFFEKYRAAGRAAIGEG